MRWKSLVKFPFLRTFAGPKRPNSPRTASVTRRICTAARLSSGTDCGTAFHAGVAEKIRESEVEVCFVTLHVGLGTFAPVKATTSPDTSCMRSAMN